MTNDVALDVRGLQKTFGDVRAIDGLDLTVATAQVHGLVGPNGAGKTTLLRILFGLVAPDAGVVTLLGQVADDAETPSTQGIGGFVEEPRFYPVPHGAPEPRTDGRPRRWRSRSASTRCWRTCGSPIARIGRSAASPRGCGSGWGSRRRSCGSHACCCSTSRPSGSIPPAPATCWRADQTLASDGMTVVVSSHNMSELEGVCDGVTVIREGRSVWHGSMERLRAESPAPAHRLETSDDARAMELAKDDRRLEIVAGPRWLADGERRSRGARRLRRGAREGRRRGAAARPADDGAGVDVLLAHRRAGASGCSTDARAATRSRRTR